MFQVKDISGYKFQSVIYLLSPNLEKPSEVFYLHKNKFTEPTNGKYIGWGGKFDDGDTVFSCSIRELEEELQLKKKYGIDFKPEDLITQGVLIRHDFKRIIYIVKATLKTRIDECVVRNEGKGIYLPINFHQKSENHDLFISNDLFFLDDLFFSNKKFETVVSKTGEIKHTIF